MTDSFPRRFGKYILLEHLAQGGMGALYLAYQGEPGMEKLCVVKTVLRELADKEYVARFRDEAKVVVRLSHGNLVPVFDAGTVEGELYIAMDHVDGKDLRAVWNQCAKKGIAFPVDVAVYIIKELARGVNHAHTAGDLQLVHRDVSPPNVLLAYSGEVKLTDFGLASSTLKLERTAPGVIYGKVSYMSPEQAKGEPLDGRADLYAAGVILWELLTGRQLFPNSDGDALDKVRAPHVTRPSLRASRVPSALDAIVMKALAPERDDRYANGEELRAALAGYLAREAPTLDTSRVASFLKELFDDEIERERKRRELLIEEARKRVALPEFANKPVSPSLPPSTRPIAQPAGGDAEDAEYDDADRSAGVLGQLIDGRYKVNRLIGQGGMGRVYEAEHIEIGKRVAIKVLHPMFSRFPEVVARFRREARAASRIGHPNIVDVTDSGTTETGAVYFVMEYLEGCDLADVIQREQALAVDRAVGITVQMTKALEAAHQVNVIHRDLKPENVFLVARPGEPDFVKVLDFGIARHIEMEAARPKLTKPNVAMGTPEYMAPEQAAGKPADGRADIYATGAILFEMLTGTSPHHGENAMEVLNKKATEVPPLVSTLRPDVSEDLSLVIAKSMARDPVSRQQTMGELAVELGRCRPDRRRLGTRELPVQPETPLLPATTDKTPVPVPRRTRTIAIAVAGAVVLLLAAGTWWRVSGVHSTETVVVPGRPDPVPKHVEVSPPPVKLPPDKLPQPARLDPPHVDKPPAQAPHLPTPGQVKAALGEASHFVDSHRLREAKAIYEKLLKSGVEKGAVTTGLARVAFEDAHYADAVRLGEKAVKSGGGAPAHRGLGDAYFKEKKYDSAVKEYREVLRTRPNDAESKSRLQKALERAN